MKQLKKWNAINYIPLLSFIIFLLLMVKQYLHVFVYYDDYGFASLSYSNSIEGVNGLNYNVSQLIHFLYLYYMDWGGRVISFGTEALLLKNGVIVMQLAMALTVTLIMIFSYKIITLYSVKQKWFVSIAICSLYGLLHIGMLRDSFYWYTSAVIYVMPFMPYLIAIYFYAKDTLQEIKEEVPKTYNWKYNLSKIGIAFVIFIASFSQEQVSISLSFAVCAIALYKFLQIRKINIYDCINVASSILGTILVVFAPGNSKRMEEKIEFYNTPFVARTIANVDGILKEVFGYKFLFIMAAYMLALLFLSILMIRKKIGFKILNYLFFIINALFLLLYVVIKKPLYDVLENRLSKNMLLFCLLFYIFFIMIQITIYFYQVKKYILMILFWASMCTISSMAFIPAITIRCYVPFVILSFSIITCLLSDLIENEKYNICIGIGVLAMILPVSYKNYIIIADGYEANYGYHIENDNELKRVSKEIKEGKQIPSVTLLKLNDTICSNIMPYEEGFSFITIWMCEYYDIPKDIEFIWKDN